MFIVWPDVSNWCVSQFMIRHAILKSLFSGLEYFNLDQTYSLGPEYIMFLFLLTVSCIQGSFYQHIFGNIGYGVLLANLPKVNIERILDRHDIDY